MRLELEGNLPFVAIRVGYRGAEIEIGKVLIDTGSASTLLSVDTVSSIVKRKAGRRCKGNLLSGDPAGLS